MVTFNTVMSLAYGPPALLGLVVRRDAELVRPRLLRGRARRGRHRELRPRVGAGHERAGRRSRLGGRLLPEPALPGDGPGARRPARRPLPAPRHAGGHGGGARGQPRPDHGGLPLPEPRDRARRAPLRAARVHRPGRRARDRRRVRGHDAGPGRGTFVGEREDRLAGRTHDEKDDPLGRARAPPGRRAGRGGSGLDLGRRRRRQGRPRRRQEPAREGQRGVGRPHRAARRRPERDRRVPGDRRSRRLGHPRSLGGAAGAAATRRERADRLRTAGEGPHALRRTTDPALLRARHERHAGDARLVGLGAGEPGRAEAHGRLAAGAARARERPGRARGLPARGRARAPPGHLDRGLRRPRASRGHVRRHGHPHRRRSHAIAAGRAARLRLHPPRREQPPGDGLLRALPARALPGPEPRPRLPPLRPPPADRARARLRRGQGRGEPGAFRRERLHGEGRLRGPRRGRGQHDRPRLLLRDGPRVRAEGERLEALRRLDGVRGADAAEGPDLPLPARRALPAAVPGGPAPGRQRALEPGPGASPAALPHQGRGAGARGRARHLVRPAPGAGPRAGGGGASERAPHLDLQRRPPAGADPGHRRARDRSPRDRVGQLQARPRPLLLLARRPVAAQPPEAGREEAERVGEPDHVRQPGPAEEAGRGPGVHQR